MSAPDASHLVSAEWLKANIEAPDLRVIEATWFPPWTHEAGAARKAYEEAHIPGAVFFDIDEIADPDAPLPHTMPNPVVFSSRIRKLGLGDGNRLIVYDRNGFCASARAWWMLRAMGHPEVKVLNGGFSAWQAVGGEIEDLPPHPVERHFTPRLRGDLIKTLAQMEELVAADGRTSILDARPPGRFTGEASEPREGLASGHMPGSRNIPASAVMSEAGFMKPAEELRAVFDGVKPPIVTSCGSGVAACILALALAEIGEEDVAVYDGSWSEWAEGGERPIETGAA
jgi:thiosulfate/3-mercaptopyruvate sulfurtransferase